MFVFLIKELREEQKISQQELAKQVGISQGYLSDIENNKVSDVSFSIVLKIAESLQVDIKRIFIATSDIENLREQLHKSIDEHGINSPETLKISRLIDILINAKMEENNKN